MCERRRGGAVDTSCVHSHSHTASHTPEDGLAHGGQVSVTHAQLAQAVLVKGGEQLAPNVLHQVGLEAGMEAGMEAGLWLDGFWAAEATTSAALTSD